MGTGARVDRGGEGPREFLGVGVHVDRAFLAVGERGGFEAAAVWGGEEDGEIAGLKMDEGGGAVRGLGEEAVRGEQEQGRDGGE